MDKIFFKLELLKQPWWRACVAASSAALMFVGAVACGSAAQMTAATTSSRAYSACPRQGIGAIQTENPKAKIHLVPQGAERVLLCRYVGSTNSSSKPSLQEVAVTQPTSIQRLTRAFQGLPRARGAKACPTGKPLHFLAIFEYEQQPPDVVRISLLGCGSVRNGADPAVFEVSEHLLRVLNGTIASAHG